MAPTREGRLPLGEDRGEVSWIAVRPPRAAAGYVLAHGAGADMRHAFMASMAILVCQWSGVPQVIASISLRSMMWR